MSLLAVLAMLAMLAPGPKAQRPAPGGAVPVTDRAHRNALRDGASALEAGRIDEAMRLLQLAHELAPGHEVTSRYLASAHTHLGASAFKSKDHDRARQHFATADLLWPDQPAILGSLGHVLLDLGELDQARGKLERAVALDRDNLDLVILCAKCAEAQDDGERAKELFARASELAPARADLRAAADRLARIASAEQGFVTLEVGPFKIQHAKSREAARGVASREAIGFVHNVLRLAHADLERELGGAPKGPICVQLYDAEQYAKVQENPLAVAFYDGKLRVPLGEWPAGKPELEGNLRHELAHAFLHGLFPKVPRWLHEGYAQLLERRSPAAARARLRTKALWLPVERFESEFATTRDADLMRRGYDQALIVAAWLGKDRRRLLELFGAFETLGVDSEWAVDRVYGCSFAQLVERARRAG